MHVFCLRAAPDTSVMEDLRRIRARNLRKIIDDDLRAAGNVSTWCDLYSPNLEADERPFSPAHIRNLMKPDLETESFGDKVARKIERAVGLKRWFLDQEKLQAGFKVLVDEAREDGAEYGVEGDESTLIYSQYQAADSQTKMLVDALLDPQEFKTLPPAAKGAIRAAIELVQQKNKPRDRLSDTA